MDRGDKLPSVRASLTIGASCAPAIDSIRTSSSVNARDSSVCTTSTPCSMPRSITARRGTTDGSRRLRKYLKPRMEVASGTTTGFNLLGDETGQSFSDSHPDLSDALGPEPFGGSQHQIRAIGLEMGFDNMGIESLANQGDDVRQGLGGIAVAGDEQTEFVDCPD